MTDKHNTKYNTLINEQPYIHARWLIFTFPGQNEPRPGHGTPWVNSGTILAIPGRLATLASGLGPASYIVTAADLHPVHACNRIFKFADDTYLVVPGVSTYTCQAEIEHLHTWATANNLQLNRAKTKEIVL